LAIKGRTENCLGDTLATVTFATADTIRGFRRPCTDISVHTLACTNLTNTSGTGRISAGIGGTGIVGAAVEVTKAVCVGGTTRWVDAGAVCTNTAFACTVITRNLSFAGRHVAGEAFQTKAIISCAIDGIDALACGFFAYSTFASDVIAETRL